MSVTSILLAGAAFVGIPEAAISAAPARDLASAESPDDAQKSDEILVLGKSYGCLLYTSDAADE